MADQPVANNYQPITVAGTSVGLTFPTVRGSGLNTVLVYPEGANVRWRDDGNAASQAATGGGLIQAGQQVRFTGGLDNLRFIREAAVSATLQVYFYTDTQAR